jgi:hypothetical protein
MDLDLNPRPAMNDDGFAVAILVDFMLAISCCILILCYLYIKKKKEKKDKRSRKNKKGEEKIERKKKIKRGQVAHPLAYSWPIFVQLYNIF